MCVKHCLSSIIYLLPFQLAALSRCSLIPDHMEHVTLPVYCSGRLGQPSSVALGVGSVLVTGFSAESSCPGSAPQAGYVGTWPCVSDPVSTEAAAGAAEPPSGVGEVFGQHSALDLCMAGEHMGFHFQLLGPEP